MDCNDTSNVGTACSYSLFLTRYLSWHRRHRSSHSVPAANAVMHTSQGERALQYQQRLGSSIRDQFNTDHCTRCFALPQPASSAVVMSQSIIADAPPSRVHSNYRVHNCVHPPEIMTAANLCHQLKTLNAACVRNCPFFFMPVQKNVSVHGRVCSCMHHTRMLVSCICGQKAEGELKQEACPPSPAPHTFFALPSFCVCFKTVSKH
eukprot:1159870-Pelagomonas_calceolata.AAC.1